MSYPYSDCNLSEAWFTLRRDNNTGSDVLHAARLLNIMPDPLKTLLLGVKLGYKDLVDQMQMDHSFFY